MKNKPEWWSDKMDNEQAVDPTTEILVGVLYISKFNQQELAVESLPLYQAVEALQPNHDEGWGILSPEFINPENI